MTHPRIPRMKPFSSFLLIATILLSVAGCVGTRSGDTETKKLSLDLGQGVSMKLVLIPAGKFKMGNHDTPAGTVKKVGGLERNLVDEYPAHEVTISKPFYMGIYEVTQAQWKAVMGTEPWNAERALGYMRLQPRPQGFDDYPVAFVDSYDAIEFCRKLSKKTGRIVSLPTEAQWEYACRAGSTTTFSFGDDLSKLIDYGWYGGKNAGQKEDYAHRVGQLKPNPWGLYDMHGNVWEFCSDWYDKDYYSRSPSVDPENTTKTDKPSLRSGAFHSVPTVSRSAQRNSWTSPKTVRYNYGLRVIVATGASAKDQLKSHFKPIFERFGQNSTTKIKVVSGPKAEDEPVEYDRTAVLAKIDEAAAKADDPEVKRALKKMRECAERSNRLLTLSGLRVLPPEIGQLTNLTGLTLHDNQFTRLPPEICQLTKLTYLGLKRNRFTTFPPEIAKLTKLEHLDLGENQLTTFPPEIGQLTTLTQLSFSGNDLSTLPPEIGQLTNLTHLRLWDNQLTKLPPEIGQLTKLTNLSLWDNQLPALPPEIAQLTNLTGLSLHDNQFTALPPEIGKLTKLTHLGLGENQFTTLPAEIGQLMNLTWLYLEGNQLTTLPPEIGQLTNLTGLSLHGKRFTTLPSEIGKLAKLVYLGLGENQFTTLPPEIGQLANLTWLYLEGNQLTTLPPEIGKLTKLTELQIGKNPLTDKDLEHLKSLKNLKRLNVRDTKVTKAGVEAFRKALPNCEVKVLRQ